MPHHTEELIEKLVVSHQAIRPFAINAILSLAIVVLAVVALLLLLPFGFRDDWSNAGQLKSLALACLTLTSLLAISIFSSPAKASNRQRVVLASSVLVTLGLFVLFADVAAALTLQQAWQNPSFWACVAWVSMVGVGVVLLLQRVLHRARPAQRPLFRLIVPLAAALLVATIYSLHCPVDALAYLLTAYLLGSSVVVAVGFTLSQRLWRW